MRPAIQKADPAYRRRLILILGLCTIACALCIEGYPMFLDWAMQDLASLSVRLPWVIGPLFLFGLPLLLLSRSLWRIGRHTADVARFPPPGMRVVRDTVVLEGAPAVRRGRLMQWLAMLLGLIVLVVPLALWWMIALIVQSK